MKMQSLNLVLLNAGGRLSPFAGRIRRVFRRTVRRVHQHLPVRDVDVVIVDQERATIPEFGIGGHAFTAHLIIISCNPAHRRFRQTIEDDLGGMVCHELHHCLRMHGPGYGRTLKEAIVTEGLAGLFEQEVMGSAPQPWERALTKKQLTIYLRRVKRIWNRPRHNHDDWFFGSRRRNIPRWTGYALGYYLVSRYLQRHPDLRASQLDNAPADSIIDMKRQTRLSKVKGS